MRHAVALVMLAGVAGLWVILGTAGCSTPRPYTGTNASHSGDVGGSSGNGGGNGLGSDGGMPDAGARDLAVASGGIGPVAGTGGGLGGAVGGDVGGTGGMGASGGRPVFGVGGTSEGGGGASSKGSGGVGSGGAGVGSGGAGAGGGACSADEKKCSGICVKIADPAYGCTASGCSPCALTHVTQATCQGGACAVGTCASGFMNCDGEPDCETDISSATHCGNCATTCSGSTPICAVAGASYACVSGCSGAQVRCGGTCTDLNSDLSNCMVCGKVCTVANGTPQCTGGICAPVSCNTGYTKCGSACQYTDGDANNCGGCNLKCPSGSLCKSGSCEVRVGYPNRFLNNEGSPFSRSAGELVALPISLDRIATLVAFGYINESTTVGAVASLGLYNSDTAGSPGTLVASSTDVVLKGSVQEVPTQNVVLQPGKYYFSILPRDSAEPKIYSSPSSQIDCWIGPQAYADGLPATFLSVAPEVFPTATPNIYLVVKQPGG